MRSTRSVNNGYGDYGDEDSQDEDWWDDEYSDLEFDRYSDYAPGQRSRGHYSYGGHSQGRPPGYESQRDPWREWFDRWYVQRYGHFPTYEQYRAWRYHQLLKRERTTVGGKPGKTGLPAGSGGGSGVQAGKSGTGQEKGSDRSFEIASETSDSSMGKIQQKRAELSSAALQQGGELREPAKFGHFHAIVNFGLGGNLVILTRGDHARGLGVSGAKPLELKRLRSMIRDEREMQIIDNIDAFPGPLLKPNTHKGALVQLCQRRAAQQRRNPHLLDSDSAALIWDLLALLLRQNCSVLGSDLAQLLLANDAGGLISYDDDVITADQSGESPLLYDEGEEEEYEQISRYKYDRALVSEGTQVSDVSVGTFTAYLLSGNGRDALEYAMRNELWGHALFLAMNIDEKTHLQVMTRFANSLSLNSPLQTLYQLLSGRQPFAVTKTPDEKWGSWRPHLAMILANFDHANPVHMQSIICMGNTLKATGCVDAAHFCYLTAHLLTWYDVFAAGHLTLIGGGGDSEPRNLGVKTTPAPAQDPSRDLLLQDFCKNTDSLESYQATEIYEFCVSLLAPGFLIPALQVYKFLYACRLADLAFAEEAYAYTACLGSYMVGNPGLFTRALMSATYNLGLRLSAFDPASVNEPLGSGLAVPGVPGWLEQLQRTIASGVDASNVVAQEQLADCQQQDYNIADQQSTLPGSMVTSCDPTPLTSYEATPVHEASPATEGYSPHPPHDGGVQGIIMPPHHQGVPVVAPQPGGHDPSPPPSAGGYNANNREPRGSIASASSTLQQRQPRSRTTTMNSVGSSVQAPVIGAPFGQDGHPAYGAGTGQSHPSDVQEQQWQQSTGRRSITESISMTEPPSLSQTWQSGQFSASQQSSQLTAGLLLSASQTVSPGDNNGQPYTPDGPGQMHDYSASWQQQHQQQHFQGNVIPPTPPVDPYQPQGFDPASTYSSSGAFTSGGGWGPREGGGVEPSPSPPPGSVGSGGAPRSSVSSSVRGPPAPSYDSPYGGQFTSPQSDSVFGSSPENQGPSPPNQGQQAPGFVGPPHQPLKDATNQQPAGLANQGQGQGSQQGQAKPARRSWFGSLVGKLMPKGPNEMILPDDSAPMLQWDEGRQKWVNSTGEEEEEKPLAPPPILPAPGGGPGPGGSPENSFTGRIASNRSGPRYKDVLSPNRTQEIGSDGGVPPAGGQTMAPGAPLAPPPPVPVVAPQPLLEGGGPAPQFFMPAPSQEGTGQEFSMFTEQTEEKGGNAEVQFFNPATVPGPEKRKGKLLSGRR